MPVGRLTMANAWLLPLLTAAPPLPRPSRRSAAARTLKGRCWGLCAYGKSRNYVRCCRWVLQGAEDVCIVCSCLSAIGATARLRTWQAAELEVPPTADRLPRLPAHSWKSYNDVFDPSCPWRGRSCSNVPWKFWKACCSGKRAMGIYDSACRTKPVGSTCASRGPANLDACECTRCPLVVCTQH